MDAQLASLAGDWHDFYALVGTAAATLVGLMFVAASIGASMFSEKHLEPMRAFFTPTVFHFFRLRASSASWRPCRPRHGPCEGFWSEAAVSPGWLIRGRIWVRIFNRYGSGIDLADRLFYALIPVVGYLAATASAMALWMQAPWAPDLMAVALIALSVAGIPNAWDMTVWIVTRSNSQESRDHGDSARQS